MIAYLYSVSNNEENSPRYTSRKSGDLKIGQRKSSSLKKNARLNTIRNVLLFFSDCDSHNYSMNAPESFEVSQLPEGAKKITITPDTHVPSAAVFNIKLEDHTMGNMIRMFVVYPSAFDSYEFLFVFINSLVFIS